jgi:type II secretory pathway pseudopilin PulG
MRSETQPKPIMPGARTTDRLRGLGFSLLELILSMTLAVVLVGTAAGIFHGMIRYAAVEGREDEARANGRLIMKRLAKEIRLVGLVAPLDADGTSDDITTDVTGEAWADSVLDDFEFASGTELIFTGDADDDGLTETVWIWRSGLDLHATRRDSVRWDSPVDRYLGRNVERCIFRYYDRQGLRVPVTGHLGPLTAGERRRVTEVEIVLVARSDFEDTQRTYYSSFPDGTYAYDGYLRFWLTSRIRGRNLWLG